MAMETTLVQTSNSSSMGDSYLVDVTIRHPACKTNIHAWVSQTAVSCCS